MSFELRSALIASLFLSLSGACSPSTTPPQPAQPVATAFAALDSGPGNAVGGSANGAAGSASFGGAASAANPTNGTEKLCGGIAAVKCPEKQYCAYAPEAHCGAADMSGTCAPRPEICPDLVDEVCGCDDKTYGNACKAARAGVSVAMKAACAQHDAPTIAEGVLCGTRGVHGDCAEGLYCAYRSACGATDAGGICSKKPQICTKIYAPVCGCDDKTYGSACTAAAAGVSVRRKGECKP